MLNKVYDGDFIQISSSIFLRIEGALPFDVYIRRASDTYTRIFPKGEPIDQTRVTQYQIGKGVDHLYITKENYAQYQLYVESVARSSIAAADKYPLADQIQIVKEVCDLTMFEIIVRHRVDEQMVGHAVTTVKGCVDVFAQDPKSLFKVLKLMAAHPYALKHSMSTATFSIILARQEKLEAQKTLVAIGLGALLHDVGMAQLPFDAEDKENLNPEEWKLLKTHPEIGKRLLDGVRGIPTEARNIVLQHHEQPNGGGYPNGLYDKQMYYPAKIVAIADSFTALVSKRPFREAMGPLEAIAAMKEDQGKFDVKILDRFSRLFVNLKPSAPPAASAAG